MAAALLLLLSLLVERKINVIVKNYPTSLIIWATESLNVKLSFIPAIYQAPLFPSKKGRTF